ncbi:hypothetical protein [Marinicella litoralis]|uniref:Uncharacterized protein n=1 Tax=Marinicella litoralis TaxID=644220 RepID=A0A4R6XXC3_9GAMM|nr:hypothetical protein [Marinicella litoralis]TDR22313.1 hypothetical protein C8D91_0792 [Marinicella litoralis]
MNFKVIHGILFILLLSLSAYVVHTSLAHDSETCEVCIQVQSNDDWSEQSSSPYLVFDTALHEKISTATQLADYHFQPAADLIRGPPSFT